MKREIKFILFAICSFFIWWMGRGFYFYQKYSGKNVHFTISTQFSKVPSNVSVFVDDQLSYYNDSLQTMYVFHDMKVPFGFHCLTVQVDGEIFVEHFFVFPVRWIYIQIQKNDSVNYRDNYDRFNIELYNAPFELL